MSNVAGGVRARLFRLIKNTLALGFILFFLELLRPELFSMVNYFVFNNLTSDAILNLVTLIFIIYFGYYILIDSKYFLDLVSEKLGSKETNKARNITYDITAIISIILASQLLTPILSNIPSIGSTVTKIVNLAFLAGEFLILYHMANQIYYLLKQYIDRLTYRDKVEQ